MAPPGAWAASRSAVRDGVVPAGKGKSRLTPPAELRQAEVTRRIRPASFPPPSATAALRVRRRPQGGGGSVHREQAEARRHRAQCACTDRRSPCHGTLNSAQGRWAALRRDVATLPHPPGKRGYRAANAAAVDTNARRARKAPLVNVATPPRSRGCVCWPIQNGNCSPWAYAPFQLPRRLNIIRGPTASDQSTKAHLTSRVLVFARPTRANCGKRATPDQKPRAARAISRKERTRPQVAGSPHLRRRLKPRKSAPRLCPRRRKMAKNISGALAHRRGGRGSY